jgi:hypothetical protein
MTRQRVSLVTACAMTSLVLGGCATLVHGPYQDVRIDSSPPGATATVSPMLCERGPNFLDEKKKQTVTTPATVRLRRDNAYRVELEKPGYKISSAQVVPSYDWLWSPVACGPCEAVGELPTYDMKGHALPVRFAEAAFYEYPKGFFRAIGRGFRIFSPEALMGMSFKLKPKDSGYFNDWHALGTPEVTATLEPTAR